MTSRSSNQPGITQGERHGGGPDMSQRATTPERSPSVPRLLDIVFGLGIWVAATAAIVLLGNLILPGTNAGFASALAYVIAGAAIFGVVAALAHLSARVAGQPLDASTGLRLGAVWIIVGLFLDGVLYAVTGFDYPNVDAARTETIAVVFMLGYPLMTAGAWWAGLHAEARRRS